MQHYVEQNFVIIALSFKLRQYLLVFQVGKSFKSFPLKKNNNKHIKFSSVIAKAAT